MAHVEDVSLLSRTSVSRKMIKFLSWNSEPEIFEARAMSPVTVY